MPLGKAVEGTVAEDHPANLVGLRLEPAALQDGIQ
jgi:hypothetical protein